MENETNGINDFGFYASPPSPPLSSSSLPQKIKFGELFGFGKCILKSGEISEDKIENSLKLKEMIVELEKKDNEIFKLKKELEIEKSMLNLAYEKINELENVKTESKKTALVSNLRSVSICCDLLNNYKNVNISKQYNEIIVYSERIKQYFTCLKLYNGRWIPGELFVDVVHNIEMINLS